MEDCVSAEEVTRLRDELSRLRRVRDAAEAYLNWSQGEPGDIAAIHEALRAALDAAKSEVA